MNTKQTCLYCNSSTLTRLFKVKGKYILKCEQCNLMQTENFIAPDYTAYHRDSSYEQSERFLKYFFEKRYSFVKPYIKNKGKVLEVGSSTGVFLDIFKKDGWKTYGVEPSQSAIIARQKGHIISQTSFEKVSLPKSSFDLVLGNHVLEHVKDPLWFVDKIRTLLKKNGILFIDVPNAGSLSEQLLGSKWPYFLPEEHVCHFTPLTLRKLLEKSGFTVVFAKTKSGIFEVSNPVSYLLLELFSFKKNFFKDLLSIPENTLSKIIDRGNSISMIAIKHE